MSTGPLDMGAVTEGGYNCRLWMADDFYTLGYHQPDSGQIHLPPGDNKDIFTEMHAELGEVCISEPHFYRVWTNEFPEVRLPAQQRLGKCKTCDEYHKEIVATRDADRRAQLKLQRKEHMSLVKKDRMVYDAMSQDVWLPVGALQFAMPVLHPKAGTTETVTFFFVPGVHPLSALRSCVESDPTFRGQVSPRACGCLLRVVADLS